MFILVRDLARFQVGLRSAVCGFRAVSSDWTTFKAPHFAHLACLLGATESVRKPFDENACVANEGGKSLDPGWHSGTPQTTSKSCPETTRSIPLTLFGAHMCSMLRRVYMQEDARQKPAGVENFDFEKFSSFQLYLEITPSQVSRELLVA